VGERKTPGHGALEQSVAKQIEPSTAGRDGRAIDVALRAGLDQNQFIGDGGDEDDGAGDDEKLTQRQDRRRASTNAILPGSCPFAP